MFSYAWIASFIIAFIVKTMAELVAQRIDGREFHMINYQRSLNLGVLAAFMTIPQNVWSHVLHDFFGDEMTQYEFLGKFLLDQIPFTCAYYAMNLKLQSIVAEDPELFSKRRYISVVLASYKFWPLITLINFLIIPVHLHILVNTVFGFIWNVWMSNEFFGRGKEISFSPQVLNRHISELFELRKKFVYSYDRHYGGFSVGLPFPQ